MSGGHHACRTIEHCAEVIAVAQLGFAGRQPHPHRQLELALRSDRSIHSGPRRRERGTYAVTGVFEQPTAVPHDR